MRLSTLLSLPKGRGQVVQHGPVITNQHSVSQIADRDSNLDSRDISILVFSPALYSHLSASLFCSSRHGD
mgnify:CR=1 FL=1